MQINGMKTYIVAIGMLMYAIGGFISGKMDINLAIQTAWIALGMMGLRHGISKKI